MNRAGALFSNMVSGVTFTVMRFTSTGINRKCLLFQARGRDQQVNVFEEALVKNITCRLPSGVRVWKKMYVTHDSRYDISLCEGGQPGDKDLNKYKCLCVLVCVCVCEQDLESDRA